MGIFDYYYFYFLSGFAIVFIHSFFSDELEKHNQ